MKEEELETGTTQEKTDKPANAIAEPKPAAAPIVDKPTAGGEEAPDAEDITNVVMLLNEIDKAEGGTGEISDIPQEMRGVVKSVLGKMVSLRDAFLDPLFKDVMDDMVDQGEDGKTPSLLVAIARNVPLEDLQELADNENYENIQVAVDDRISKQKKDQEDEESLLANFEESQKAIDAYAEKNGYDEAEKEGLYSEIKAFMDIFADGVITEAELEKFDKMRNYDADINALKESMPQERKKEVLPDKASIGAPASASVQEKQRPMNSLEQMAAMQSGQTDITDVGKRKRR